MQAATGRTSRSRTATATAYAKAPAASAPNRTSTSVVLTSEFVAGGSASALSTTPPSSDQPRPGVGVLDRGPALERLGAADAWRRRDAPEHRFDQRPAILGDDDRHQVVLPQAPHQHHDGLVLAQSLRDLLCR